MGTDALNIAPINNDLIVTVDFVKTNFLFGISLKDDDGNEMPGTLIEFYIRSATEWLEDQLQIRLRPVTVTNEAHDLYYQDYLNFNSVRLFHRPVRRLTRLALEFPMMASAIEFDPEWFRAEHLSGYVCAIPSGSSISKFLIGAGGAFLPFSNMYDQIPFVLRVDYEAGFDGANLPAQLAEIIAMKAALGPLNIAGDLIAGAGIANKSLSLDGLSQTVGTTSSATNAGYGARIIQYNKEIKERLEILVLKYRGIAMIVA